MLGKPATMRAYATRGQLFRTEWAFSDSGADELRDNTTCVSSPLMAALLNASFGKPESFLWRAEFGCLLHELFPHSDYLA